MTKAFTILDDSGHGGKDPGVTVAGRRECDSNLLAAKALRAELQKYEGISVILSHEGHPVNLQGAQRAAVANAVGADLLISLHADSAAKAGPRGHHVIYSKHGDPRLAEMISDAMAAATGRPAFRKPWTKALIKYPDQDWYAIIRNAKMPAIIVERGFLTSPEDAALLFDEAFLAAQAKGIAAGVASYFGLKEVIELPKFKDVPAGHWAADAIEQAVAEGWASGFPDNTFRPNETLTRAQAVAMMVRALESVKRKEGR